MTKNSSLIYKLFNTSCIDRVVNIVSKYSVKLSLEFVKYIHKEPFLYFSKFNYRFLLFFYRPANMMGRVPYITD